MGLDVDDVLWVLGKVFGKRRRVKVSRINRSGTFTRKMDYAAVKTEGAIKFRPHRSTDLLCFLSFRFANFISDLLRCSLRFIVRKELDRIVRKVDRYDFYSTKVGRKLDENWTNRVKNSAKIRRPRDISAMPRASKVDNSRVRSQGETKVVRSKDDCDRESILPRFRDFSYRARPTRFIELCYFFLFFFFFFFIFCLCRLSSSAHPGTRQCAPLSFRMFYVLVGCVSVSRSRGEQISRGNKNRG